MHNKHPDHDGNPDGLTPRQLEIMKRRADGQTNKEIASELGISEKTVDSHLWEIKRKLNIKNPAQLIKMAVAFGLSPL